MSTFFYEPNAFDILVRNFFNDASNFSPLAETKIPHPVDIYTNKKGLFFEVACTGIPKEELKIETQDNILRINYDKNKETPCCEVNNCEYIHKGIAKRSFNLGWKIDSKFDLSKINAEFKNGLLKIEIPFAKKAMLKEVKIN